MVDHYGPTEVSIAATGQVWRPGSQVEDHIGHPLRGAHVSLTPTLLGSCLMLLAVALTNQLGRHSHLSISSPVSSSLFHHSLQHVGASTQDVTT